MPCLLVRKWMYISFHVFPVRGQFKGQVGFGKLQVRVQRQPHMPAKTRQVSFTVASLQVTVILAYSYKLNRIS